MQPNKLWENTPGTLVIHKISTSGQLKFYSTQSQLVKIGVKPIYNWYDFKVMLIFSEPYFGHDFLS